MSKLSLNSSISSEERWDTTDNDYAVNAFDHGAVDYLLKPLDRARLAVTIQRLKAALGQQPADMSGLEALKPVGKLQWIQTSIGNQLRFISINDVQCFRADAKYTVYSPQNSRLISAPLSKILLHNLNRTSFGRFHAVPLSTLLRSTAYSVLMAT